MIFNQNWKLLLRASACTLFISLSSCTTINSGLQSGDLPPMGAFVADNGMTFNVQPLNLASIPPKLTISNNTVVNASRIRQLVQSSSPKDYQLSSGDILSIHLMGYPEITPPNAIGSSNPYASGYPIDQQGYIQFPLIGRIKASGFTVVQFTNNLQTKLQRYLKFPDPQVKIVNYRGNKFFIDGDVRDPGEFSIADAPVSLYSAISMAGGATPTGDSNNIELIRNGQRYTLGLRNLREMGLSANQIYLQDGDSIHLNSQDRNKVYVLGELGEIDPVDIPEQGLTLAHVLGQSRGLNSFTADAAKVYVVRDHSNQYASDSYSDSGYTTDTPYTDIYYVNLQTVTNLALANRFNMQPNDIVYVDPTGLTRWSRFINSVLPSATALRQLSSL